MVFIIVLTFMCSRCIVVSKWLRNENGTTLPNGKIRMQKHFLHLSWGSDLVLSSKLSTREKNKFQKTLVYMRKKNSKESQHDCTASLQQKLGLVYIHPHLKQQQIKWLTNCKHNKSCSWKQLRYCV